MRRASGLLPQIIDPGNLRLAFWKAAKGKRYAQSVLDYQNNLDVNLQCLRQQILSGSVSVGDYRYFKVYEPKERQICASAFREQVLHHAMMNVCHPYFDRAMIFDSYASRKGKGTFAALERARVFTRRYEWFLKLDVRKFFESVHHTVMKQQLAHLFKEEAVLYIRLVARGIIEGSKRPFFAHTMPFFGHIAPLYSLKKPSCGQKMTLFSLPSNPAQQVYFL